MKDEEFPKYMPDSLRETKKFPRSYIANCAMTILPDNKFYKWVMNRVVARNTKVAVQNNLNVALDPKIADAFARSNAVSGKYPLDFVAFLLPIQGIPLYFHLNQPFFPYQSLMVLAPTL